MIESHPQGVPQGNGGGRDGGRRRPGVRRFRGGDLCQRLANQGSEGNHVDLLLLLGRLRPARVHSREGKVINIEGDPEHPISEGSLCAKGSSIFQVVNNANRVMKPRYRAPGRRSGRKSNGIGRWTRSPVESRTRATDVQGHGHHVKTREQKRREPGRTRSCIPRS